MPIRSESLNRSNWARFHSGGERAAAIYSLIETAKLNGRDPEAWLRDVISRIADHPMKRIAEPIPWNWDGPARLDQAA